MLQREPNVLLASYSPAKRAARMDFFDAVRPLYLASKWLCLAPFAFDASATVRRYATSLRVSVLSTLAFALLCAVYVLETLDRLDQTLDFGTGEKVLQFTGASQATANVVMFCVSHVANLVHRGTLMEAFNEMHAIRSAIGEGDDREYTTYFYTILAQQVVLYTMYTIMHAKNSLHIVNYSFNAESVHFLGYNMMLVAIEGSNCTAQLQFTNSVLMVGQLLRFLRKRLEKATAAMATTVGRTQGQGRHSKSAEQITADELQRLARVHLRVCELAATVNSRFGLQNLVDAVRTASLLVFTLFIIFVTFTGEQSTSRYWDIPLGNTCGWFAYTTLRLLSATAACHWAAAQACRLSEPLARQSMLATNAQVKREMRVFSLQLLNNPVTLDCLGFLPLDLTLLYASQSVSLAITVQAAQSKSQPLRRELRGLSLQLLGNMMTFDSLGFFTIDLTLFQSIIAAVTTYLVIVVQFHIASDRKIY